MITQICKFWSTRGTKQRFLVSGCKASKFLQHFGKSQWPLIASSCAEIFWELLPYIPSSMSHCWCALQKGLPQPTLTSRHLFALTSLCNISLRVCFLKQELAFPFLLWPQRRFPDKQLWLMHIQPASPPKIIPFDFQTNKRRRMEQVAHLPEKLRGLTWFPSNTGITAKERTQVQLAEPFASALFMHCNLHYLPAKRKVRLLVSLCRSTFLHVWKKLLCSCSF